MKIAVDNQVAFETVRMLERKGFIVVVRALNQADEDWARKALELGAQVLVSPDDDVRRIARGGVHRGTTFRAEGTVSMKVGDKVILSFSPDFIGEIVDERECSILFRAEARVRFKDGSEGWYAKSQLVQVRDE